MLSPMAQHYLVTGGLGFLGAPLVRALVAKGHRVRVLDNASRGSLARLGEYVREVEVLEGDVRDRGIVDRAIKNVDSVCHLAYVNGTRYFYEHPAYVLDVAVKGMMHVLDACIHHKVPELILASSSEVYQKAVKVPTDEFAPLVVPDPRNPRYSYGGGKILCELMTLHYGKEYFKRVLIFRPHNVYGPDMGFEHVIPQFVRRMEELKKSGAVQPIAFPMQGDGSQTRSFIYISDFTDGLLCVLERGEHLGIYHIGTTEEVTIRQLADGIADCMGIKISVVPGKEAAGGTPRRCPDIRALEALGFMPRVSLCEGLKPTVAWYSNHPEPSRSMVPAIFLPSV